MIMRKSLKVSLCLQACFYLLPTFCKPRVSVITSTKNAEFFIEGFLSTLVEQTIFSQCEFIIINAASCENEERYILEYAKKYPNIIYKKLISDPGLYAVWNYALKLSSADLITNANVDDRLACNSLELHAQALEKDATIDLVYSDFYVTKNPNEKFDKHTIAYCVKKPAFKKDILLYDCLAGNHPMWRRSLHEKYGYFNENFKIAGDCEFWLRIASSGALFKHIPEFTGLYYENPRGLSTSLGNRDILVNENNAIKKQYGFIARTKL
jgi:glycosyltransferase involved in cell wall biosynthesis